MSTEIEQCLKEFVEAISAGAEQLFAKDGYIRGVYILAAADGWHFCSPVCPVSTDRTFDLVCIKAAMRQIDAAAYAYVDEAWVVSAPRDADLTDVVPTEHPHRYEVVTMIARDIDDAATVIGERPIIREAGKPPRLGPLSLWEARQLTAADDTFNYTERRAMTPRQRH
jgi:hypothetical protein